MEKTEFERIVDLYADVVFRAAVSCSNHKSDAEDAVQNTFLKLWTSEVSFENDEHIRRWLVRVAVNECRNEWKSFRNRRVISLQDLKNEPEYELSEENRLLEDVLKLPKKYSVVIYLYYYEEYRCAEIAKILKISESNVQTRLMRARKLLKEKWKEV